MGGGRKPNPINYMFNKVNPNQWKHAHYTGDWNDFKQPRSSKLVSSRPGTTQEYVNEEEQSSNPLVQHVSATPAQNFVHPIAAPPQFATPPRRARAPTGRGPLPQNDSTDSSDSGGGWQKYKNKPMRPRKGTNKQRIVSRNSPSVANPNDFPSLKTQRLKPQKPKKKQAAAAGGGGQKSSSWANVAGKGPKGKAWVEQPARPKSKKKKQQKQQKKQQKQQQQEQLQPPQQQLQQQQQQRKPQANKRQQQHQRKSPPAVVRGKRQQRQSAASAPSGRAVRSVVDSEPDIPPLFAPPISAYAQNNHADKFAPPPRQQRKKSPPKHQFISYSSVNHLTDDEIVNTMSRKHNIPVAQQTLKIKNQNEILEQELRDIEQEDRNLQDQLHDHLAIIQQDDKLQNEIHSLENACFQNRVKISDFEKFLSCMACDKGLKREFLLNCGHVLCVPCSLRKGHVCPICRKRSRIPTKVYW